MKEEKCCFCSEKLYEKLREKFHDDAKKIKKVLKADKIYVVVISEDVDYKDFIPVPFTSLLETDIAPQLIKDYEDNDDNGTNYNRVNYVQLKGEEKNQVFSYVMRFLESFTKKNSYKEWDSDTGELQDQQFLHIDTLLSVHLENEDELQAMAEMNAPLFLLGERGTGKTTIVRKIFEWKKNKKLVGNEDKKKGNDIIEVQCGNIPKGLEDDRFFGHEEGAYTGATKKTDGFIGLANDKILFLDEIQDLSKEMQRKLIEVLRTGKYYRIGGDEEQISKFQLVVATNRSVAEILEKLDYDFYDRISTFQFELPSLRDFKEKSYLKIIWTTCWYRYFEERKRRNKGSEKSPIPPTPDYENKKETLEKSDYENIKETLENSDLRGNYRDIEKLIAYIDKNCYNKNGSSLNAGVSESIIDKSCKEWKKRCDERDKIELMRDEMLKAPDTLIKEWVESEYREDNHGKSMSFDYIIKNKVYTLKGDKGFSEKFKKRLISASKNIGKSKEIAEWLDIDQKTVNKYLD